MDYELLISLCVLWLSSTWCLFAAAFMWLYNDGEAFHPHCVDMEQRHKMYQVVGCKTSCKIDFAVKSVSAFIAPRGTSSDKQFTVFLVMGAVAGFLGSLKWHSVGDATFLEASLCQAGFFCLLIVGMFEVDVSSAVFLEEKLIITCWLLEKLGMQKHLKFDLNQYNPKLLEFLRESKDIHHLYEEDDGKRKIEQSLFSFTFSMHALGATGYVVLVTAAIIMNEIHDAKVAWITGLSFFLFTSMGYLTGTYVPILPVFKGWILLWNPFLREPDFLDKLQHAVNSYCARRDSTDIHKKLSNKKLKASPRSRKITIDKAEIHDNTDSVFKRNGIINLAHKYPQTYLRVLSHVIMTIELIALVTPMIALGIQWITSLCHSTPPVTALLRVIYLMLNCVLQGDYECHSLQNSCIVDPVWYADKLIND